MNRTVVLEDQERPLVWVGPKVRHILESPKPVPKIATRTAVGRVLATLDREREATAAAEQRLADARHAIVQASINLANEDTVAAHAEIERARAALADPADPRQEEAG